MKAFEQYFPAVLFIISQFSEICRRCPKKIFEEDPKMFRLYISTFFACLTFNNVNILNIDNVTCTFACLSRYYLSAVEETSFIKVFSPMSVMFLFVFVLFFVIALVSTIQFCKIYCQTNDNSLWHGTIPKHVLKLKRCTNFSRTVLQVCSFLDLSFVILCFSQITYFSSWFLDSHSAFNELKWERLLTLRRNYNSMCIDNIIK